MLRREDQWCPHRSVKSVQPKLSRHDSNHRVTLAVDGYGLTDDGGIRIEAALPNFVAEYHYVLVPGLALFLQKCAAQHGLDIQHLKIIGGDIESRHTLRLSSAGESDIPIRCGR